MSDPQDPAATTRIVQGHPTGFEPGANKGGQNGAPKPDGRSPPTGDTPVRSDTGAEAVDPDPGPDGN